MKALVTGSLLIAIIASTTYYISAGGCCGGGIAPEPEAEKEEVKVEEKKACCSGKAAEDVKACCKGKLTTVKKASAGHACCAGKDADKVKKCCDGKLVAAPKADFVSNSTWLENIDTAKELAGKTGKQIMAMFSGSDWCTYCIKLKDDILSKKVFKDFAADSLILIEVDFPREKAQSAKLKAANTRLAETYGVTAYPTVLLLKADGSVIARTGYLNISASEYVTHLEELMKTEQTTESTTK